MTPAIPRALAVLLLVLGTSLPAHAHNESHPPADGHHADAASHIGARALHRVSPSCPGVPGHLCCCGNIVAATGAAKLAVAAGISWHSVPEVEAAEPAQIQSFPPVKTAVQSRARPRAPPISS